MEHLLEPFRQEISDAIVPLSAFRLFADLDSCEIHADYYDALLQKAEEAASEDFPPLLASTYMLFAQTGDRGIYEAAYFKRRRSAFHLLLGEMLERKGRFLPKLIDLVWMMLEESTWVIPAHNRSGEPLPIGYDEKMDFIDLFSAETGAVLAMITTFLREELDRVTPILNQRIRYELNRRILLPYLEHEEFWWMGYRGHKCNNWTPWICSNVLTVAALCEEKTENRRTIVEKTLVFLDRFTSFYHEDGGCDEGPGYWNEAGAAYFDCTELIFDLTSGKISLFELPMVRKMGEYIANVNICDDYFLNYADGGPKNRYPHQQIARFGRRAKSETLENFALTHQNEEKSLNFTYNSYRFLKNLCEKREAVPSAFFSPKTVWFPGIAVSLARENADPHRGFCFSMKGGHNAESHNHNDLGTCILFSDGEPILIDAGVGTYCANTFNENRYTIWTMQSAYHNLPTIGGVMQKNGKEFSAKVLAHAEETGAMTLDLSGAYPEEAKIRHIRYGELKDGIVTVEDRIQTERPSEVEFHWMTADTPMVSNGTIVFAGNCVMNYSPSLDVRIERITLDDPVLRRNWNRDAIYRICMTAKNVASETFSFRFTKK